MTSKHLCVGAAAILFTTFQASCVSTNATKIGNHAARTQDCKIEFLRLDMSDREQAKFYEVVGIISVATRFFAQKQWTETLQNEVRSDVCAMGGDAATISSSSDLGATASVTSIVGLRRKPDAEVFGTSAFFETKLPELRTRAAFDLNCDEAKLEIVDLNNLSRGVRGCDKQATYRYVQAKGSAPGYWEREPQ